LISINAIRLPPSQVSCVAGVWHRGTDDMTIAHFAYRVGGSGNTPRESPQGATVARYEHDLAKQERRLREALAREEALLRRNDELIQQRQLLRKLLAWQESTAERFANLTPRQHQILELVLAGHPSKNIAADLGVSRRTVENHRASIMKKTGAKSLPALARLAIAAASNSAEASQNAPPDDREFAGMLADRQMPKRPPRRSGTWFCRSVAAITRAPKTTSSTIPARGFFPLGHATANGDRAMLQLILIVVLILVVLSFFGGYSGYVPPHFGYGGGGLGIIVLIVFARAAVAVTGYGRGGGP
jgi:DNA-binding CsgD family transcriptional regulator